MDYGTRLTRFESWHHHFGFLDGLRGQESTCKSGDPGLIPGTGRSLRGENGNPPQYSCLEDPMDRGAWRTTVHGVAKSRTRLTLSHVHIIGSGVPKLCLSHGHCQLSHYFGKGLLPWSPLLRVHLCGLCISWIAFCSWETAVAVWLGNSSGVRLPACAACCFIGVTLGRIPKLSVPQLLICKMG